MIISYSFAVTSAQVDVHVTGFPSPTAPEQDRLQVFVCGDDDAALEARAL